MAGSESPDQTATSRSKSGRLCARSPTPNSTSPSSISVSSREVNVDRGHRRRRLPPADLLVFGELRLDHGRGYAPRARWPAMASPRRHPPRRPFRRRPDQSRHRRAARASAKPSADRRGRSRRAPRHLPPKGLSRADVGPDRSVREQGWSDERIVTARIADLAAMRQGPRLCDWSNDSSSCAPSSADPVRRTTCLSHGRRRSRSRRPTPCLSPRHPHDPPRRRGERRDVPHPARGALSRRRCLGLLGNRNREHARHEYSDGAGGEHLIRNKKLRIGRHRGGPTRRSCSTPKLPHGEVLGRARSSIS